MHKIIIIGGVVLSFALLTASCSGDDDQGASAGGTTGGVAGASATGGEATAGGGETATGGQAGAGGGAGGVAGAGGETGGQGGAGGGGGSSSGLAIVGTYLDNWDSTHEITDSTWTMGMAGTSSVFHITIFSNADQYLIAQNDAANQYSPSLWSRFDWTQDQGILYYCQTAYDAASEQAALDTPRADVKDLAGKGCGGFAWSKLTPN